MTNYIKAIATRSPTNVELHDDLAPIRIREQFWFFDDGKPEQVRDAYERSRGLRELLTTRGHRVQVSIWRPVAGCSLIPIGEHGYVARQGRAA